MRGEQARVADRVRELLGIPPVESSVRFRWDPGRRGAAAVGTAVLVAIAVTAWWLLSSRPGAVPVSAPAGSTASTSLPSAGSPLDSSAPTGGQPSAPGAATVSSPALAPMLIVDVAGKVRHPGIYRLPPGSRIYDAIEAAGGARPGVDLVSLNLAAPVQDGQQIVVGRPGAPLSTAGPSTSAGAPSDSSVPGAPVNLNSATLEQLDSLPGVGPVLAQHILDWRTQHGQFTSTSQLNDVSGIGEVKFAELRELVTV